MSFFRSTHTRIRERQSPKWVNNRVLAETEKKRKGLNPVSKKGIFWQFVNRTLNKFFLKLDIEKVCEQCQGTSYCGPLTPAHTRRRQDIPRGDWWYAFRVAVLGSDCHRRIDEMGRRAAEPVIEQIIRDRFKKLGLTELMVKELLIECAEEVRAEDAKSAYPKFQEFVVEFPPPEAPYEIPESVWTE